ncbi:hypothetical protein BGX24_002902 [Mortierella sp. AD032]|nr:hypothetical protein BGX24_002902 [Mortierella sp. AD032]
MYKCALVHQAQKMVTYSPMPVGEAIMKLDTINTEKDANGRWISVLAYAVAGFCTAPMFLTGSTPLSLVFVAEVLRQHNVCTSAIKFAGIVMILPGFTITCSILKLSSRHIISQMWSPWNSPARSSRTPSFALVAICLI